MNFTTLKTMGIAAIVFASNACLPAMAQDVGQHWNSVPRPTENRVCPLDARQVATTTDDSQGCTEPPATASHDWGLDDCLRPCRNDACPCVYVQVGALLLHREPRFANQPIIVDAFTGTTLLSTSDLNSNFGAGLQATVGMRLSEGHAVEFDYFGLFDVNSSAVVARPDLDTFLIFPDNLAGNVFVDMDQARVDYSSSVHSFAVNFLCCSGCCDDSCCSPSCGGNISCRSVTWFAGFRYLNLAEELNIAAQRTVGGAVEEGAYGIQTNNHLYGAQLGARLRRTRGRFGWDATGFAGIFGNDARQTQSVTDFPNFPLRPTVSNSSGNVAFVGGANLSGLYLLNDVWNIRAGYNVLWIEGVALAPDQLDFDLAMSPSGNQIHNDGGMFLHGVNVGLEARW